MIIGITPADRDLNQSAVDAQGIQMLINSLNSMLVITAPSLLSPSPFGPKLINPIPMGPGIACKLPWQLAEFQMFDYPIPIEFKALQMQDHIQISIATNPDATFSRSVMYMQFDEFLTLKSLCISFGIGVSNYATTRQVLMNAAFTDLPTILGYLVTFNTRSRTEFTLGDPRSYNVNGSHSAPTQTLGDVRHITNPRDNPTGITKSPHERSGHKRRLPSGQIIEVAPSIVHREDYVPDNQPKKLKY